MGFAERLCEQGTSPEGEGRVSSTERRGCVRLGADSRGRDVGPAHAGSHGRKSELSWGCGKTRK